MSEYMVRKFHPVGQGALFSETFNYIDSNGVKEKTTIVYDCGAGNYSCCSTRKEKIPIEKQIEESFESNEKIKAVFISHLDCDHCNGLPFLLKHCCVEHLFLPLMTDNEKLYYLLKQKRKFHNLKAKNAIIGLIIDTEETVKRICSDNNKDIIPKLHWVLPIPNESLSENETRFDNFENLVLDDLSDDKKINIRSGLSLKTSKTSIFNDWVYIPYNFKFNERHQIIIRRLSSNQKFNKYLKKDGNVDLETLKKDISLDGKLLKDLSGLYKKDSKIFGNINENSMALFSGITKNTSLRAKISGYENCKFDASCRKKCYLISKCTYKISLKDKIIDKVGALYLGDFNAKKVINTNNNRFWKSHFFSYLKQYIGIFQQPHHGAETCFTHSLVDVDSPNFTFFNYGNNNKYSHPNKCSDIKKANKTTFHVTEDKFFFSIIYPNYFTNYGLYSLKWEIIKRYEKVIPADRIKCLSEYEDFEDKNNVLNKLLVL